MFTPFRIGVFVVVVTMALIAFDFYLFFDGIKGNTYSAKIRSWGIQYRALPYLIAAGFGALLTHWFTKRDRDGTLTHRKKFIVSLFLLLAVAAGMAIGSFW